MNLNLTVELVSVIILLLLVIGLVYGGSQAAARQTQAAVEAANRLAEEQSTELRVLKELAETLNQTLPPEQALQAGLNQVARQMGASTGWLLTLTADQKAELAAGYNLPPNMELARSANRSWALCNCLKSTLSSQLLTPTLFECERLARMPGVTEQQKHHLSTPIRASGVQVGILNLVFPTDRVFDGTEIHLLSALSDQFGGAVERARLFKEVHKLAITDSLTGLFNRRHFSAMLEKEMERARRYQHPLVLAILDLDHFKQINDTYGHMAGDQALQEVSQAILEVMRRTDLVGRFGGEEITILMPETSLDRAHQAMERLRIKVEQLHIPTPRGTMQFTISVGLSNLDLTESITMVEFLDRADQALYLAKNSGRNQVRVL